MAISISINGHTGREGFLIAPAGSQEFAMPLSLKTTDSSTITAQLAIVAPKGVTVKLSKTDVTIGPRAISLKITAQSPSKKAGDITLQVKVAGRVKAGFILTSIKHPRLRFSGRFQARFATDGDFFNEPRGTAAGWTFALEGEPDFVPSTNNIPIHSGMAVGRVVRFQNAVAPRPHVAPIGVTVKAVEAQIGLRTVSFTAGDPIIGEVVNLGPNTYLAANEPIPPGPQPFETYGPGFEPMENFELHIGHRFSGKPGTLNDRPKANGFFQLTAAELTKFGVIPLTQFVNQRKQLLLTDYHNLSPADRTGTVAGRNLATRIGHLGGSAPDNIPATQGTLPPGWSGKETYNGLIDDSLQITPGNSLVMAFLKTFAGFRYSGTLLNFHSDELCGQFEGTLEPFTVTLARQMPAAFRVEAPGARRATKGSPHMPTE
jgi:hypothetical protein